MGILVREIITGYFHQLNTHVIKVDLADEQLINGDRSKIKQVIRNLLSDAIKYPPGKSAVKTVSKIRGNLLEVSVCDSGSGISNAHQEKLNRVYTAYN